MCKIDKPDTATWGLVLDCKPIAPTRVNALCNQSTLLTIQSQQRFVSELLSVACNGYAMEQHIEGLKHPNPTVLGMGTRAPQFHDLGAGTKRTASVACVDSLDCGGRVRVLKHLLDSWNVGQVAGQASFCGQVVVLSETGCRVWTVPQPAVQ